MGQLNTTRNSLGRFGSPSVPVWHHLYRGATRPVEDTTWREDGPGKDVDFRPPQTDEEGGREGGSTFPRYPFRVLTVPEGGTHFGWWEGSFKHVTPIRG